MYHLEPIHSVSFFKPEPADTHLGGEQVLADVEEALVLLEEELVGGLGHVHEVADDVAVVELAGVQGLHQPDALRVLLVLRPRRVRVLDVVHRLERVEHA